MGGKTNKVGRWDKHDPGDDPPSVKARQHDEYWLCQCGLVRRSVSTMFNHCKSKGHDATYVDQDGTAIMSLESHT